LTDHGLKVTTKQIMDTVVNNRPNIGPLLANSWLGDNYFYSRHSIDHVVNLSRLHAQEYASWRFYVRSQITIIREATVWNAYLVNVTSRNYWYFSTATNVVLKTSVPSINGPVFGDGSTVWPDCRDFIPTNLLMAVWQPMHRKYKEMLAVWWPESRDDDRSCCEVVKRSGQWRYVSRLTVSRRARATFEHCRISTSFTRTIVFTVFNKCMSVIRKFPTKPDSYAARLLCRKKLQRLVVLAINCWLATCAINGPDKLTLQLRGNQSFARPIDRAG